MMFQVTNLFVYKLIFGAALFVAETMFLFRQKKRSYFPLRLGLSAAVFFGLVAVFPLLRYDAVYSSLMFSVFFINPANSEPRTNGCHVTVQELGEKH